MQALVLGRTPLSEASLFVTLLTEEFGLLRARSQGARNPGAKMAAGIATFAASDVTLLRGREGWRMAGAMLVTPWARRLSKNARMHAARVTSLTERLVHGDHADPDLFHILKSYLEALHTIPETEFEAAEMLAVVRVLSTLGFDAGDIYGAPTEYSTEVLERATKERLALVSRINRGISASGA